jgi:DNA-directed RNA polymerase specialized sigma24 family protein
VEPGASIEARELAEGVLARLPRRAAEAVWSHHAEGESFEVIAARQGVSRQSVQSIAKRAVRRARELCGAVA